MLVNGTGSAAMTAEVRRCAVLIAREVHGTGTRAQIAFVAQGVRGGCSDQREDQQADHAERAMLLVRVRADALQQRLR